MAEIRRKEETLFEFCLDILLFGLRYIGGKGNNLRSIMYKSYRRRSFVSITINDSLRNIKNNDRNRSKSNSKRETPRFFPNSKRRILQSRIALYDRHECRR